MQISILNDYFESNFIMDKTRMFSVLHVSSDHTQTQQLNFSPRSTFESNPTTWKSLKDVIEKAITTNVVANVCMLNEVVIL